MHSSWKVASRNQERCVVPTALLPAEQLHELLDRKRPVRLVRRSANLLQLFGVHQRVPVWTVPRVDRSESHSSSSRCFKVAGTSSVQVLLRAKELHDLSEKPWLWLVLLSRQSDRRRLRRGRLQQFVSGVQPGPELNRADVLQLRKLSRCRRVRARHSRLS